MLDRIVGKSPWGIPHYKCAPVRNNHSTIATAMAVRRASAESITSLYNLKPGDHIKVDEVFYYHHMIVVNVVSYNTIRVIHNSKEAGRVEESNVCYTPEDIILLVYSSPYSRQEIIRRARQWIGKEYNLLWDNCEHFATEVRTGEGQSLQVKKAVAVGAAGLAIAIGAGLLAAGVAGLLSSDRKGKKTDSDSDSEQDTHAQ